MAAVFVLRPSAMSWREAGRPVWRLREKSGGMVSPTTISRLSIMRSMSFSVAAVACRRKMPVPSRSAMYWAAVSPPSLSSTAYGTRVTFMVAA